MTDRWRTLLRVSLFFVAVGAVVLIAGAGMRTVLRQETAPVPPPSQQPLPTSEAQPQGGGSLTHTLLGFYISLRQGEIQEPANANDKQLLSFRIEAGETAASIGPRLEKEGLIRDAGLFAALVRYRGIDSGLEVGDYQLSPSMSLEQIVSELQHGRAKALMVTIPEGWRMEQVAAVLQEAGLGKAEDYLALMKKQDYPYTFLQGRPQGAPQGLEGFLFPDTYQFAVGTKPEAVIATMLRNYDNQVTAEIRKAMANHGLSFYEAMTLAAIVEREAVVAEERPTIAAVFLSRLDVGMYLQADPTVAYAKGFDPASKRWWTPMAEEESKSVVSPYNTFLHPGLPPGPICSPGLSSIKAVAQPASTKYLYFMAKGDGSHAFAVTFEEHLANVRKYQK